MSEPSTLKILGILWKDFFWSTGSPFGMHIKISWGTLKKKKIYAQALPQATESASLKWEPGIRIFITPGGLMCIQDWEPLFDSLMKSELMHTPLTTAAQDCVVTSPVSVINFVVVLFRRCQMQRRKGKERK